MSDRRILFGSLLACLVVAGTTGPAAAEPTADDKALATSLFDRGVAKMKEGGCEQTPPGAPATCREALDAFQRAFAIYPAAVGSLKNAAFVEKNLGMLASAVRDFRELARLTKDDPRPERRAWADLAKKEIDALVPRVPRLTIVVPAPAPADLSVAIDGRPVPKPAYGTEIPVDPGAHEVTWTTSSTKKSSKVVLAEAEAKSLTVTLDAAPAPVASTAPPAPAPEQSSSGKTGPLVLLGTGAVAVGVGLTFGALAWSARSSGCDEANVCDADALDRARSRARVADVATGLGLAAAAAGGVWWLLLGDDKGVSVAPAVTATSAGIWGKVAF